MLKSGVLRCCEAGSLFLSACFSVHGDLGVKSVIGAECLYSFRVLPPSPPIYFQLTLKVSPPRRAMIGRKELPGSLWVQV